MAVPPSERVVFASVFEALVRIVNARKPELKEPLSKLGVDLTKLQAAYPADVWKAATSCVAQALFPQQSVPIAEYRLGQLFIHEYEKTLIGRALMTTLKVVGPRRAFGRISRSFRTGNNFTEDRVTPISDSEYELWINEVHVPFVNQGVIQAALETIGAKNCSVEVKLRDSEGTTYRCKWD